MQKILIPTKLDAVAADTLNDAGYEVVHDADSGLESLLEKHSDSYGLIVRSEKVTADIIDQCPNLKVIVRAGAGYDNIDIKHARRQGIDVMNTPGANSNAVAEEVVALILAVSRHVLEGDASVRSGKWEKKKFMGRELTEKTVGIVGLGNIGQLLVQRLSGFENRILAFDPVLSQSRARDLGVELVDLETLFKESDVISLHLPETDQTRGMINWDFLGIAKDNLILVNCARAGVVVEADLRKAKDEKGLLYCNDVYPKDAEGDKSIKDVAAIMLPHLGASTYEANYNAARRAAEQLIAFSKQGIDRYVVNKALPEGLDEAYQRLAYYLARTAYIFHEGQSPRRIEVSFYGDLNDYSKWLIAPIVLGFSSDFDPLFDHGEAQEFLDKRGIELVVRESDDSKNYGNSMTIDLLAGKGNEFTRVSVRGTLAEGNTMVSRINGFDKLYFDPVGTSVLVSYDDQPGMLGKISSVLGKNDINIIDVRCPQDESCNQSLAVFKVNKEASKEVLQEIRDTADAIKAVSLKI